MNTQEANSGMRGLNRRRFVGLAVGGGAAILAGGSTILRASSAGPAALAVLSARTRWT